MSIIGELSITALLVTLGKWAKGEGLSGRFAVGAGFVIVFLFILQGINQKLAEAFGALVLFTAVLTYAPDLAKRAGLVGGTPPTMSGNVTTPRGLA